MLSHAEKLLQELGITEPGEIDLEAIAFHMGAEVLYRPLDGCEARIIGRGNRAIISVNASTQPRRRRFSIAHELGHWRHHRGQCHVCRLEDFKPSGPLSPEKVANQFAADMLLPNYILRPLLRSVPKLSFKAVREIGDRFDVSLTATAIRIVESDQFPAILICGGKDGRKWFYRAPSVPSHWYPTETLSNDSFAFDIVYGGRPDDGFPRKTDGDTWFDRSGAGRYEIFEQSARVHTDDVLTLLILHPEMMDEAQRRRGQ